jgi:hypothetical protein
MNTQSRPKRRRPAPDRLILARFGREIKGFAQTRARMMARAAPERPMPRCFRRLRQPICAIGCAAPSSVRNPADGREGRSRPTGLPSTAHSAGLGLMSLTFALRGSATPVCRRESRLAAPARPVAKRYCALTGGCDQAGPAKKPPDCESGRDRTVPVRPQAAGSHDSGGLDREERGRRPLASRKVSDIRSRPASTCFSRVVSNPRRPLCLLQIAQTGVYCSGTRFPARAFIAADELAGVRSCIMPS